LRAEGYKLYQEVYELTQGAQIHDILLEPIDDTPPTVMSVSPTDGSTGVPTNAQITATFDDDIDDTTLTNTSFSVIGTTAGVFNGTVTYNSELKTAKYEHVDFFNGEDITVTITTDVTDTDGNAFEADYVWSFTAGDTSDTNPPSVPGFAEGDLTVLGTDQIEVMWQASTDDVGIAGYEVARGTTSNVIASVASTSYTDTGLSPGTPYTYYVIAKDLAGNYSDDDPLVNLPDVVWAGPVSATTEAADTTAPKEVTNFNASAGDSVVTLTWTNPTDSDFDGVWIMRRDDGIYPTDPEDPKAVGIYKGIGTKYTDLKVTNGTTYLYKIFTFDREPNLPRQPRRQKTPRLPQK